MSPLLLQAGLYAWVTWVTITLGCTGLLFLHHTTRGRWSLVLLRLLEAGARQLWLVFALGALLVIPNVWAGEHSIYPWLSTMKDNPRVTAKVLYLNPAGFTIRYCVYFLLWIALSSRLIASSDRQDRNGDEREAQKRGTLGAWSMVLFILSITPAYVDWVMSLDPAWSSTMFPAWFMMGGALMALGFCTILLTKRMPQEPWRTAVDETTLRDIGNMMLTLTLVWAYFSLSQFLIMWSANIPVEVKYYQSRFDIPALNITGGILIGFQWLVPFLALLAPRTKRVPAILQKVAILSLLMRFIDIFWTVVPFFMEKGKGISAETIGTNVAAMAILGVIWIVSYYNSLKGRTPLPLHDARLQEALAHVQP